MAKQDPGDDLSKEIRQQNKLLFHCDLLQLISEPIRLRWQEKWRIPTISKLSVNKSLTEAIKTERDGSSKKNVFY